VKTIDSRLAVPKFDHASCCEAADSWGLNCGPAAIAAMCGLTLDALRPLLGDFEKKGHTNPTLMWQILRNLDADFTVNGAPFKSNGVPWPRYGLARVQWEGPWTAPGVPIRVRYRHTHWVGAMLVEGDIEHMIFDVNCMAAVGGWVPASEWSSSVVPHIVKYCEPKADGKWHLTHVIEIRK
jgi:hypothetical protein